MNFNLQKKPPFEIEPPDFDNIVKATVTGSAESNWQPSKLDWNQSSNRKPFEHSPTSIEIPVKSLCFICETEIALLKNFMKNTTSQFSLQKLTLNWMFMWSQFWTGTLNTACIFATNSSFSSAGVALVAKISLLSSLSACNSIVTIHQLVRPITSQKLWNKVQVSKCAHEYPNF